MFHLVLRSSASTRTATQTLSAGHAINSSMRGAVGTLSHRNFAVRKPRKGTNETEADMAKRPVYWVDPKDVMKYKADVKVARRKIIDEVEALAAEKERLNPTPIKLSIFGDDWDLKAEAAKDPLMDVYQLGHLNAFDRAKLSRVPKITTKVKVHPENPERRIRPTPEERLLTAKGQTKVRASLAELSSLVPSEEWLVSESELDAAMDKAFSIVVPVTTAFANSMPKKLSPLASEFMNPHDQRYYNDHCANLELYTLFHVPEDKREEKFQIMLDMVCDREFQDKYIHGDHRDITGGMKTDKKSSKSKGKRK